MRSIITPLLFLTLLPAMAFAQVEYDHTLPDSIGWGVCFSILLLIMGYRFSEGPAALIGAIILGYWGFQAWEIFNEKPMFVARQVYQTQVLTTLVILVFAFLSFLSLCKRKRD